MAMNIDDVLARLDPYRKQMRPDWEMTLAPADYDVIRNHVLTCKDYDVIHSRIAALEAALAAANARADANAKDAERYRFLRDSPVCFGTTMPVDVDGVMKDADVWYSRETLDAAVDDERAREEADK